MFRFRPTWTAHRTNLAESSAPWLLLALLALGAMGCGGGAGGALDHTAGQSAGFGLTVLDDTFSMGGAADGFCLQVDEGAARTVVSVTASGARDLKALYCELTYDASRYTPQTAQPAAVLGGASEILSLMVTRERGKLVYGQVLADWPRRGGVSGDCVLARMEFLRQPSPANRLASAAGPPLNERSRTTLSVDSWGDGVQLNWFYLNNGDYDQNGIVNITDITPLGANLGLNVAPDRFPVFHNESAIDGDNNGALNVSDLTPIGAGFQSSALGGYNVYYCTDANDAPSQWDEPNGAGAVLLTNVPFSAAQGDPSRYRKAFALTLTELQFGFCWVRPTDGATYGSASNLCPGTIHPEPAHLALTNPPAVGNGTFADPYIPDVFTDYSFSLNNMLDGEVSCSPATNWLVTPLEAGSIEKSGPLAVLHLAQDYFGDLNISATYKEMPSNPSVMFMRIFGVAPWAELTNPPQYGDGSEGDPFHVDRSTDYILTLTMEADDVSVDPLTVWTVTPSSAGAVDTSGGQAVLRVDAAAVLGTDFTVEGEFDGLPSHPPRFNFSIVPVGWLTLILTNPPPLGDGTPANPYIASVYIDYVFQVIDPVDGDVTLSPNTTYTITPAGVGSFDPGSATLDIDDSFTGDFNVSATYNGVGAIPTASFMRVPPPPPLEIYPDPADTDWPPLQPPDPGSGHDFPYYILSGDGVTEYSLLADDLAGPGGNLVDVNTLSWHAFPAEWLVDWAAPGTFRTNASSNCYLYAHDGASQESNHIYIEVHGAPAP